MDIWTAAGVTILSGSALYAGYRYYFSKESCSVIKYLFSRSPKSVKKHLISIIEETKDSLDIAIFLFTEKDFILPLCRAAQRGVDVRVISDRKQSLKPKQAENIRVLIDNGIPVKVNDYDGSMHLKVMIADKKLVTAGSYNFTYSAENKNDEVVVVIRDKKIAEEWQALFEHKWKDSRNYSTFTSHAFKKHA
ncbi:phospholipase D-like domain-containing protein [Thalassobacillus pellis]|uniref:phospholipase D-like domain-containing protein n=1 Tax=Thalassobacillus pellis TaxID=748008 RepID=UPI0019607E75|nr:phospholipase D-like domain-containing protein [Thalassobacillus pellis]MBM7553790.1 phosphatidylserine/phosphatidylglycerophosphate/cardiolipin synthase-like enzyme [Thalassobacillus pellis]